MEKEIQTKNGISGAWVLKTLSISKQQKNEIAIKQYKKQWTVVPVLRFLNPADF